MLGLLGPLTAAAVVSLVPGLLVGRALGLPWRWAPVLAPALSAAVVGGWAALGGPVTWPAAVLGAGLCCLLAVLVRWTARRRAARPPARTPRRTGPRPAPLPDGPPAPRRDGTTRAAARVHRTTGLVLAAGGALVGAAALAGVLARSGAQLGAVNQLWDAAWHANLTRLIADSADGRPSAAGRLIGAGWRDAESWYPSGLHVQAALVERATSTGVSASVQAVVALHVVLVLPVVLAALAWVLSGEAAGRDGRGLDHRARGAGAGVAAVVGVLPTAFPLDRVWRPAWPMTVGFVLALVAVLALVVCADAARRGAMPRACAAAVPLVAVAGAGLVHPSGAVVAVLLALGWATGRALARRGAARTRGLLAVAGLLAVVAGATVVARDHVGAVGSVFAYDYRLGQGLAPALASVAGLSAPVVPGTGYGVPQDAGQPLAGALLVAGALGCALTRGARWLAGLWVVLVLAALETFTPVAAPLTLITGWFFNVESRLVALVALVGALAAGVAVASGASRLLTAPVRAGSAAPREARAGAWPVRVITLPAAGVPAATRRTPASVGAGMSAVAGSGGSAGSAGSGPDGPAAGLTGGERVLARSVAGAWPGAGPVPGSALVPGTGAPPGTGAQRPVGRREGDGRRLPACEGDDHEASGGLARGVLLGVGAAGMAAAVLALGVSSAERAQPRVHAAWTERVVGEDARAVMDALARQPLPRGGRILNDPLDGSPWLYALTGTMPMFTHYDDRDPSGDAATLLDGLSRADTAPRVRDALEALSVCYVYDAPVMVSAKEDRPEGFVGLDGVAALEPVARSGGVAAYAVVPPPEGCAVR